MKKNVAIICGGDSSEWIVSVKSGKGIYSFIDEQKYNRYLISIRQGIWEVMDADQSYLIDKNDFSFIIDNKKIKFDCAYITIHGTPGENGLLQGYFEMLGIPYTSCNVLVSALTFNKFTCNQYLKVYGIKVAESLLLRKEQVISDEEVLEKIGLPCFIKSNVGGSSFGVTKVKEVSEIQPAIAKAFQEGKEVIIERFISGTEVTCGCYKIKQQKVSLPITEVVSKNEFFDFEAKYTASKVEEITPARISEELTIRIQQITSFIYDILGCQGIIRIDFIIGKDGIYLLEVNTTPGMTETSFIPQQIKAAGLNIKEVMTDIIEESIRLANLK
ncbi:MAG: D-alanine--D-alanine ligase [Candidatus Azobacteroides sp.]|nr:D-alanine--D-alanine ligase [Candidatus Azobacteroides sp.]